MDNYLQLMLNTVREGGHIALGLIDKSRPELKADHSVITEADRLVSSLVHARLAPFLSTGEHVLIDEEDAHRSENLAAAFGGSIPFVWSVDPIDGTRAYANRMPQYGISIGLIKDRRPWLGAVYFPSLAELFYCDGTDAFFVKRAFTPDEEKVRLVPVDEEISGRSVMIVTDEMSKYFRWASSDCHLMTFSTAVCELCWPAIGRGCGSLSRVHLWDMAGSWPIFEKAGLQLFSIDTGEPLVSLQEKDFEKTCRLKGYHILSSSRNFPILREKIVRLS
jgi:myo-inositol-1(or 4)-monophosphatase